MFVIFFFFPLSGLRSQETDVMLVRRQSEVKVATCGGAAVLSASARARHYFDCNSNLQSKEEIRNVVKMSLVKLFPIRINAVLFRAGNEVPNMLWGLFFKV